MRLPPLLVVAVALAVAACVVCSECSSPRDDRLLKLWYHEDAPNVKWVVVKQWQADRTSTQQHGGGLFRFCMPVGAQPDLNSVTSRQLAAPYFIRVDIELIGPVGPDDTIAFDYDFNGAGIDYRLSPYEQARFPLEIKPEEILSAPDDDSMAATAAAAAAAAIPPPSPADERHGASDSSAAARKSDEQMTSTSSTSFLVRTLASTLPTINVTTSGARPKPESARNARPERRSIRISSPSDGDSTTDDAPDSTDTPSDGAAAAAAVTSQRVTMILHAVRDPIKSEYCRCGWSMLDLLDGVFSGTIISSNITIGEVTFAMAALQFTSVRVDTRSCLPPAAVVEEEDKTLPAPAPAGAPEPAAISDYPVAVAPAPPTSSSSSAATAEIDQQLPELPENVQSLWTSWVNWSPLEEMPEPLEEDGRVGDVMVEVFGQPGIEQLPLPQAPTPQYAPSLAGSAKPFADDTAPSIVVVVVSKPAGKPILGLSLLGFCAGVAATLVLVIVAIGVVGTCVERMRQSSKRASSTTISTVTTTTTGNTSGTTTTTTTTVTTTVTSELTSFLGGAPTATTTTATATTTPGGGSELTPDQIQSLFSNTVVLGAEPADHIGITMPAGVTPGDTPGLATWNPAAPQMSPLFVEAPHGHHVPFEPDLEQGSHNPFSPSVLLYPFYALMRLSPSNLLRLVWDQSSRAPE